MSSREVIKKLRALTHEKYSLMQIAQIIRCIDKNSDGIISKDEGLQNILKELKIVLSAQETRAMLRALKATEEGVKVDEFLNALASEIPEKRMKPIEQAFKKLSPNSADVKIDDLVAKYQEGEHINFFGRKMTIKHFKEEIAECFDLDMDGTITYASFNTFYRELSVHYQSDEEWEEFMAAMWGLN